MHFLHLFNKVLERIAHCVVALKMFYLLWYKSNNHAHFARFRLSGYFESTSFGVVLEAAMRAGGLRA